MGKKILVLLESPGKIKKISSILNTLKDGNNYHVEATMGHISRIADCLKYKIGIDFDTFEETYELLPEKEELVKKLRKSIKDYDLVYAASDPDREGNSISYHWFNFLKIPKSKFRRVIFKEITEKGVKEGISSMQNMYDEDSVQSARARAELDKIIGYRLSGISTSSIGAKSAGRVQSAALKIVCDREREILAFKPEKYYELFLNFTKDRKEYKAIYKKVAGNKKQSSFKDKKELDAVVKDCKGREYKVSEINEKEKFLNPKDVFTTSTLQQTASTQLGYTPKKTMQIAQKLYENGLISYMRTDSVRISDEFIKEAEEHIVKNFGKKYYKGFTSTKQGDQDGHEGIRPIHLNSDISTLDQSEKKLYNLIFNRTLASLMAKAKVKDTEVIILNNNHRFFTTGRTVIFDGFMKVFSDEDEMEIIPLFKIDEKIKEKSLDLLEKETQPPNRYSEAGIVKALESFGIGRPSTMAPTIETLKSRKYIELEKKTVFPTELGMKLSELLDKYFGDYINTKYTAQMETTLDEIANGKAKRVEELKKIFDEFNPAVLKAAREIKKEKPPMQLLDEKCPLCGGALVIRQTKDGKREFKSCSRFPKCRFTQSLDGEGKSNKTNILCPKCNKGNLIARKNKKGETFYGCSCWKPNKAGCDFTLTEQEFKKAYVKEFSELSEDRD